MKLKLTTTNSNIAKIEHNIRNGRFSERQQTYSTQEIKDHNLRFCDNLSIIKRITEEIKEEKLEALGITSSTFEDKKNV